MPSIEGKTAGAAAGRGTSSGRALRLPSGAGTSISTQPPGIQNVLSALAQGGQPQGNQPDAILPLLMGLSAQKAVAQNMSPGLSNLMSALGRLQLDGGIHPTSGIGG